MYTLYWLDGMRSVVNGDNIKDAFTLAGYGAGALRALDFYAHGDNKEYKWNSEKKKWESFNNV